MRKLLAIFFTVLCLGLSANVAHAQTNYPVDARLEIRDENGNILDLSAGVFVGDDVVVFSSGWFPIPQTPPPPPNVLTVVAYTFFSDPIDLGTSPVNDKGETTFRFKIPDVEPGMHTLRLDGTGANGQPRRLEVPVKVLQRGTPLTPTIPGSGGGSTNTGNNSTQVLGKTSDSGLAFAKTGLDHLLQIVQIGLALFAAGAVIVLAVRRSRRATA